MEINTNSTQQPMMLNGSFCIKKTKVEKRIPQAMATRQCHQHARNSTRKWMVGVGQRYYRVANFALV